MNQAKVLKSLIWAGAALFLVVLVFLGLFLFLQTNTGRVLVASRVSALLSSEPDRHVAIEGLEGLIPLRIRLNRLTVSDAQGAWLNFDDVVLRWSPSALLAGKIKIEEISASTVKLDRLPPGEEETEKEDEKPFQIPESIPPVTIEQLAVREFFVDKSVAGEAAVFRVEGSLLSADSKPGVTASLHLARTDDGPQTRADITLTPRIEPPVLEVQAEFKEDEGGWAAAVLGLENAGMIRITINGDGPPADWKGSINGTIYRYGAVQTDIRVQSGDEQTLSAEGKYEPGPYLFDPESAPLPGSETLFAFTLRFAPPHSLILEKADFKGEAYSLKLLGKLDYVSREVESSWDFQVDDLKVLEGFARSPLAGEFKALGSLSGTIEEPKVAVSAHVKELQTEQVGAGLARMDLTIEPIRTVVSGQTGFKVTGDGSADGLRDAEGKALPESSLKWTFNIEAPREGDISIRSFHAESESHMLELSGRVNPDKLSGTLDAMIHVKDMKSVTALLGEEVPGDAKIEAHIEGDAHTGSASGNIKGRLVHLDKISPRFAPLIGPELKVDGSFELRDKTQLFVPQFKLESPVLSFKSELSIGLHDKAVKGSWQLSAPKLEPLTPIIERPVFGSIEAEGSVEGSLDALVSTSTVKGSNVVLDGREFKQVTANVHILNVMESPQGNLRFELSQADRKIDSSTDFRLEKSQLSLSKISIEAPGARVSGDMVFDLEKTALSGDLEGRFKEVTSIGHVLGEQMAGSAEFNARFLHEKGGQNINITLKGSELSTGYGSAKTLAVSANLTDVLKTPQGTLDMQLREFERPGLTVQSLDLKASGDDKGLNFEGGVKGKWTDTFDLETRGVFSQSRAAKNIRLSTLEGSLGEHPFNLIEPLALAHSAEGFSLDKLSVAIGAGRLEASGRSTAREMALNGDFQRLPLGMLSSFGGPEIRGTAAGSIRMAGKPSRPTGSFDLRLADLRSADPALREIRHMVLTTEGKLEGDRLALDFELARQTENPARGNVTLPLELSIVPLSFSMPPQGPIQGHLEAQTDLSTLTAIFPLEGHKITGRLSGFVDIRGTVADPEISGNTKVENGTYENFTQGTVLKNLTARIAARDKRLEIEQIRATDGERGSVSVSGWVDLMGTTSFPMELSGTASRARLVRRDDLNGTVSGEFKVSGSMAEMALAGKLEVESAEYDIPRRFHTPIAQLKVIEINGAGRATDPVSEAGAQQEGQRPQPLKVNLDLGVTFPGRALVRGRGLNSEWEGELRISGSAGSPSITGNLSVVRGQYNFLGERFNLVEGFIRFYGETPPAPVLDVTAETRAKDVTARLILSGPASAPNIRLESDPPLPSDEVLSRVLFKRSLTQLTPVQALRLANALRALSGRGGTLDFMGRAREFLHVEQLELREMEEKQGEFAVGVGKYLTEEVYIDVEKGVGDETGKVSITVEITPNLTLESKAGTDASTGLGLNWKRDY